eukprot:565444-Rhodomonas_salina.2
MLHHAGSSTDKRLRGKHRRSIKKYYAVDCFSVKADAYFLTHVHADHLVGLLKKDRVALWDKGNIYCSDETSQLLQAMLPGISTACVQVHCCFAEYLVLRSDESL